MRAQNKPRHSADPGTTAFASFMALTFHKLLAGCQAGESSAWMAFVREYGPLARAILGVYTPLAAADCDQLWRDCLRDLADGGAARLKSMPSAAEREFLLELRVMVLTQAAIRLKSEPSLSGGAGPSTEAAVRDVLKDLPLLHQVIVFLKLAGYTDASIEQMLRITPAEARRGLERLEARYPAALGGDKNVCLWPRTWLLDLLLSAWAAATSACVTPRQMIRILDGQTNWYDKEPMERHVAGCLTCLERWAALREVVYWRRVASRLPEGDAARFLNGLPGVASLAKGNRRRPWMARLLG